MLPDASFRRLLAACLGEFTSSCMARVAARQWPPFVFFNVAPTTQIYTLSLHDALPISPARLLILERSHVPCPDAPTLLRSEEHTSELQSRQYVVCRLLLEKIKAIIVVVFVIADTGTTRTGRGAVCTSDIEWIVTIKCSW